MTVIKNITKSQTQKIHSDEGDLYDPPPEYSWTRQRPWISLLGHFNYDCSVLIIPTTTKSKKPLPPVIIIKKPHKKLSVGFIHSKHHSQFDEYDHLILWQDKIYTKLPASVIEQYDPMLKSKLYKDIPAPTLNFNPTNYNSLRKYWRKKSLDEIIEIPIKLFNYMDVKLPQKIFQEAKKYLRLLNIVQDGRCKHEDKNKANHALDIIITYFKTNNNIKPHRIHTGKIVTALELEASYNRRSTNRIIRGLLEAVKHTSSKSLDDAGSIRVIKKIGSDKLKEIYWDFKEFLRSRKTPPPLRIASK